MPTTLTVFEVLSPDVQPEQVATLTLFDEDRLRLETTSDEFAEFLQTIEVRAGFTGPLVSPHDPGYVEALADSIERSSGWLYLVRRKSS